MWVIFSIQTEPMSGQQQPQTLLQSNLTDQTNHNSISVAIFISVANSQSKADADADASLITRLRPNLIRQNDSQINIL